MAAADFQKIRHEAVVTGLVLVGPDFDFCTHLDFRVLLDCGIGRHIIVVVAILAFSLVTSHSY